MLLITGMTILSNLWQPEHDRGRISDVYYVTSFGYKVAWQSQIPEFVQW